MGDKQAGVSEASFLFTPGASPAIGFTSASALADEHSLPNFPFLDASSGTADHSQELRGGAWEMNETPGKEIMSGSPHIMPSNFTSSPSELSSASTAQGRSGHGVEAAGASVSEADLRSHFGQPLQEVASRLGLHINVLKQLCRKYGIIKWPSSKLAAMEKHIATLRAQIEGPEGRGNTQMHADLAQLESQRDKIYAGNLDEDGCSPIDFPSPGADGGMEWKSSGPEQAADAGRSEGAAQLGGKGCSVNPDDNSFFPGEDYFDLAADGFGDGGPGASFQQEGAAVPGSPAICSSDNVPLEKLYEENSSLKAISKYLMQERQDLMKKLETLSSQSNNMKVLSKVLKHHIRASGCAGPLPGLDDGVGIIHEHGGGLDDVHFAPSSVGDMLIETGGSLLPGLIQQEEDIAGGEDGNTDLSWFRTESSEHVAPSAAAEGALANFCESTPEN